MTTRVLKYRIPVDGAWHVVPHGYVVHVGNQDNAADAVTVWSETLATKPGEKLHTMALRVYGTGESLESDGVSCGSCIVGPFVWHVYKKYPV